MHLKYRLQYVGQLSRPRSVDGPGEALVHFLTKSSPVPPVIYEFNL